MEKIERTALSAGIIIGAVLRLDEHVMKRCRKVFPVVTDKAESPYVVYRRSAMLTRQTVPGMPSDTVEVEVTCFAEGYQQSVDMAEAVRAALDGVRATDDEEGLNMRCCTLTGSDEGWQDDCYIQTLVFKVQI